MGLLFFWRHSSSSKIHLSHINFGVDLVWHVNPFATQLKSISETRLKHSQLWHRIRNNCRDLSNFNKRKFVLCNSEPSSLTSYAAHCPAWLRYGNRLWLSQWAAWCKSSRGRGRVENSSHLTGLDVFLEMSKI